MSIDNLVQEGDVVAFSRSKTPQPLIIRKEFFSEYAQLIKLSKKLERELQVYMAGNYHEGCPVIEKPIIPNMDKVIIATAKRPDHPQRDIAFRNFYDNYLNFSDLPLIPKLTWGSELPFLEKLTWGFFRMIISYNQFNQHYALGTVSGEPFHPERLRNKKGWHLLASHNVCYDSDNYQDWAKGQAKKDCLEVMGFSHIEPIGLEDYNNHCFDQEIRFVNIPFTDDSVGDIVTYLMMAKNTGNDLFYVEFDVTGNYSIIRLDKYITEEIDKKTGRYYTGDEGRDGFEYRLYQGMLPPEMFYEVRPMVKPII